MEKSKRANALDRFIGYVSPRWQLRRMQNRAALQVVNSYYDAGGTSRRTQGWKRPTGDANAPTGVTLSKLRDAARQLVRNNGYAESGIGTIVDDVVGWGILPTAKNERWAEWSSSTEIDAEDRHDLTGLQQMVIRTVVESGECLVRRRPRRLSDRLAIPLQIQILEPDYLDSSKHSALPDGRKIIRGIEFDARGRRIAYHLFREHPGASTWPASSKLGESDRVPAGDILHIFKGSRPGQVRGASWFAPVLIRFNDFDDFADATLMKQKIAACLAVLTTDVDGSGARIGGEDEDEAKHDLLEPGLIANLPPGRNIEVVNPPTVREYGDYVKTTLQEIASGLGVTPEDLTGDYSSLNFSAARMSRLRHWGRVEGWRWRMMIPQFLIPLWSWAMFALELAGEAVTKNDDWTAPPLPFVEPDKEGLAIIRNIRGGIITPDEALRERGYDPAVFWNEYAENFARLDELGIVLDSDARKMTQAGQAQFTAPHLSEPPDGPPEEEPPAEPETPPSSSSSGDDDEDLEPGADDLISVAQASKRFGIHPDTIRAWCRKGAIPHRKVGPRGVIRLRARDFFATGQASAS